MIQANVPDTSYQEISMVFDEVKEIVIGKNRRYGNSALAPLRVFSKCSPIEGILVRIDDKLSRLVSGQQDEDEDVVLDLIGYLVLLRIARRRERTGSKTPPAEDLPWPS